MTSACLIISTLDTSPLIEHAYPFRITCHKESANNLSKIYSILKRHFHSHIKNNRKNAEWRVYSGAAISCNYRPECVHSTHTRAFVFVRQ
jgi:hypothetical protein